MKAFIFISLMVLTFGITTDLTAQVDDLPFHEDFEQDFKRSKDFLDNWKANTTDSKLLGQQNEGSNRSLYMVPEGEHLTINADLSLNLSGKNHVYMAFDVATRKNGSREDQKRTKLSVSISTDGGKTFGFGMKIGPEMGMSNTDSKEPKNYKYPFPPLANGKRNVVIRFKAKAGGGPHKAAKLLIDDVKVSEALSDRFAPFICGEVSPSSLRTMRIDFSEPLALLQAENPRNYVFTVAEIPQHLAYVSPTNKVPRVNRARVINDGYSVLLGFSPALEQGEYYTFNLKNITDLAGNDTKFTLDNLVYNVPKPGDLMFTEVLFNDPSGAHPMDKLQFVEIFNPTNRPVPLGGLRIKGAISAHNMPNVKVYPGKFWVVTRNAEAFEQTFGFPAWEWKGSWIQYDESHEGETIESQQLYIQTTVHHGVSYVDKMTFNFSEEPWKSLNEAGRSMELCNIPRNKWTPETWVLANNQGKPYEYYAGRNNVSFDIFATPLYEHRKNSIKTCGVSGKKIIVCHKTPRGYHELCIDPADLRSHLNHGDQAGSCEGDCSNNITFRSELEEETIPITDTYLTVTPNPVREMATINISPDLGAIQLVKVLGINGRKMRQIEADNQTIFSFPVNDLPAGMYLLQIRTDLGSYTERLVVQ